MTHNRRARAAITISGRIASNLYPGIEPLQQAVFLCQLLGIESMLQASTKDARVRSTTPREFLAAAFHGEALGCIRSASTGHPGQSAGRTPRIRPLPNTADIT